MVHLTRLIVSLALGVFATVPAWATLVDINAKINTSTNPVDLVLAAGTYTVTPIGTADGGAYDAWNPWGGDVSGCDPTGEHCTTGWENNYSLASDEWGPILVTEDIKYATPLLALAHAQPTTFTLTTAGVVHFFAQDCCYDDNIGGMSLRVEVSTAVPEPAQAFGMAGLAHLQTARLNVVAIGGGTPDPSTRCLATLSFMDASGGPFTDAGGMPIALVVSLEPGQAVRLDLRAADAFRGRTGLRVAFRAQVELPAPTSVPPNPCTAIVPTLEIYDTLIGRTALLYPGDVAAIGGGSPDPGAIPFGVVGLGRLQTGRLNVVALGGGTPDPSDLPICPMEVGFVDDMGEPFRDPSGMPIAARFELSSGEARALDLRATDAFRGLTSLRVAFRAVARVIVPPSPCLRPLATLEVFDNVTGRSALLYAPMGAGR